MSHRAEEKERRRQERLAAEEAAKKSAERRKRLGLVGAVALVAAVAVFVVFVIAGGDDGGSSSASEDGGSNASVPAQQIDNLAEAARAARCTVTEHNIDAGSHVSESVEYETNPPTSGDHDPAPAEDGFYPPDGPPDVEQTVHSLEHGRILFQYKEGTPQQRIDQLEAMANEKVKGTEAYHTLVFQNQTNMEPAVAATGWGRSLTCDAWNGQVFDALRAFRRDRVDKGAEFVP